MLDNDCVGMMTEMSVKPNVTVVGAVHESASAVSIFTKV